MTAEPVVHGKPARLTTKFRPRPQHVFGTAFVCGPILAAVAPLGMAPLFTVATVAALIIYLRDHRQWPWPGRPMRLIALAFISWLALSALWTVALPETLRFLPRAILYIVMGLGTVVAAQRIPAEERRVTDLCLLVGLVLGLILFAVEIATDGAIASGFHWLVKGEPRVFEAGSLNRSAAVFAILCFPAALAAQRRFGWRIALLLLAATLALSVAVQGHKAALSVAIGVGVLAAGLLLGRRLIPLVAAGAVVLIVTAPLQPAVLAVVPGPWTTSETPSVTHRILIWQFVSDHVRERPLLGWGLNTSRVMPGGKLGPMEGTELLPLHPHNAPLQLWLELGGIGALIAAAGVAAGVLSLRRLFRTPPEIGLAAAGVAAAGLAAAVGYGAWQGWWISTLWLAAAAIVAVAPAADQSVPVRAE
jgi:O-antigen ligase